MSEEWRPVAGYEGLYEVSNLGRVKSLARMCQIRPSVQRVVKERIIKTPISTTTRYPVVQLHRDGRRQMFTVHSLVATAFHGPRPSQTHQVCHNDGSRTNNHADNLRWGTPSDNVQDAIRHGTHSMVAKTHCPQGHPYSPENTRVRPGERACKTCLRARSNRNNKRRRAVA